MLECTKRFTKGIGVIDYIKNYESNYLDEREKRDGQGVILSHLFLLLGCTIPVMTMYILNDWLPENQGKYVYLSLSGLFFVGLGDSTAALIGRELGETWWSWFNSCKTIEGSVACFLTVLISYMSSLFLFKVIPYPLVVIIEVLFTTGASTFFEATTKQFDNLLCPLFYFSMLTLLNMFYDPIFNAK